MHLTVKRCTEYNLQVRLSQTKQVGVLRPMSDTLQEDLIKSGF